MLSKAARRKDGAARVPDQMNKAAAAKVGASLVVRRLMREIPKSGRSKAEQHSDERQREGDGLAAFPRGRPQRRYSTLSRLADCLP